jgi:hypothetical protein
MVHLEVFLRNTIVDFINYNMDDELSLKNYMRAKGLMYSGAILIKPRILCELYIVKMYMHIYLLAPMVIYRSRD